MKLSRRPLFKPDFRSDTVTQPTQPMLQSLLKIKDFQDCVLGTDDNVLRFENKFAKLFGKEKGLFMLSGTMANQVGMLSASANYSKPISAIGHKNCHLLRWESSGISFLSRVLPITISKYNYDSFEKAANFIQDTHVSETKICILENTLDGQIQNMVEFRKIYEKAQMEKVHVHLDGCRIWHAAIVEDKPFNSYGRVADSISLCFSKGLGAPVGALLLGTEPFIERAKYYRKLLGGGIRQSSGI
eukprot:NODE_159_length_15043_cov_0.440444.p6 type:complete len:244 gc:universal NODE_159_length_15043_cov_0.440444:9529-8798(-)